jgi:hypothetical protein
VIRWDVAVEFCNFLGSENESAIDILGKDKTVLELGSGTGKQSIQLFPIDIRVIYRRYFTLYRTLWIVCIENV